MGLTSTWLAILAIVLAAGGLTGSALWIWPRLSARTWPAVAGRVGVLAGTQALTLMALGLLVNNYFGFYGSWSDLLGTGSAPVPAVREVEAPDSAPRGVAPAPEEVNPGGRAHGIQVIRSANVYIPGKTHKSAGRLSEVMIPGAATGLSTLAYIYLPPQYFAKEYENTRFPVIVGLTGYPGDPRNLISRMNMPAVAARAIEEGRMPPTVLVLTRPTVAPPRDTECMDVPGGPQVESYFTRDLKRAVAGSLRVATTAAGWGVLGGSTGGYCALKLSMRHPEAYSAAVSLSGYFQSPVDATTGDLFGGSRRLRNENDLMWRLSHLPHPPVSVLVTTSRQGESNYLSTLRFLDAVRSPMRAASLILPSGGHNFTTWNRELPQALPWLARRLDARPHAPAPVPVPAPDSRRPRTTS
ncbi:alpha/beta hydrolase [Sphaerisporangium aureirubrum]|uniref:Alpha/beta hydrolase n=1 Tax=Sphaerisporangium aureirubrum TaxID=1544736 RepID=A0ABW1NM21_9ACTN